MKMGETELIPLIDAQGRVRVVRIDGGAEVLDELKEYSIEVGTTLEVVGRGALHEHSGPLIVEVDGREVLIPRGIAERITAGGKRLLDVEEGRVAIEWVEMEDEVAEGLEGLGITEGKEVSVKGHDMEKTFRFRVDGKELTLGDGEAAKILVRSWGEPIQANFLKGRGIVEKVIGGTGVRERLGNVEGRAIELVSVEEKKAHEEMGGFVIVRVGDREVVLGRGIAEKIWVK